jgi:hypothetical protein
MQKSGQFMFVSVLFIYIDATIVHICIKKLFSQSRKLMLPSRNIPFTGLVHAELLPIIL